MSTLYENLLKATDNLEDIAFEKYATITKINGNNCSVKETETGLEHTNVPILNCAKLETGDKVIIGFLNNSIYDVIIYGALDKEVHDDTKQDLLVSGTNIKTINNQSLLGSGNINIQGGGGSGGVVMVGSFRINDDGDLIVTLPTGTLNPYHIDENGDLIYSTNPQITGGST